MKGFILLTVATIFLFSCNYKESNKIDQPTSLDKRIEKNTIYRKHVKELNPLSKKIIGIWTSEASINADFKIDDKTIYYVEDFANYEYTLQDNFITIKYPDFIYKGTVSFKGDTLILSTKEREDKYWKFTD